jgi:hypothetical protein
LFFVFVIIIIAVFVYFKLRGTKDFEPLIKEKLQQLVLEGSDSLYRLDIDKIEVDISDAHIIVKNASLNIDSARLVLLDSLSGRQMMFSKYLSKILLLTA